MAERAGPGAVQAPRPEVEALVADLDKLLTAEAAAVKLVRLGPPAIEPLRRYLLHGRPSAVFQPRRWAVRALSGLGAREVLLEYLRDWEEPRDAETRLGEDVVRGEAALLLSDWPEPETIDILLDLAERRAVPGVLEALTRRSPSKALPLLARALGDDFARPTAERLLRDQGDAARSELVSAASAIEPNRADESDTIRRRRCAALRLLEAVGIDAADWLTLRAGLDDEDLEVRVRTAALGAAFGPADDQACGQTLLSAIPVSPWFLQDVIEDALTRLMNDRHLDVQSWLRAGPEATAGARRRLLRRLQDRPRP